MFHGESTLSFPFPVSRCPSPLYLIMGSPFEGVRSDSRQDMPEVVKISITHAASLMQ